MVEASHNMAAASGETHSACDGCAPVRIVALVADAFLDRSANALKLRVEHEVHDATDRVRTIDCRGARRHDIDPLHQALRDRVRVDNAFE